MTRYRQQLGATGYVFDGLVELLAKATPLRSGDELAGCTAGSATERAAAQWALAEVALTEFLNDPVVPYETDEATRLIIDTHDRGAFQTISHLTVGELRYWLLAVAATDEAAETGPHPPSGYGPVGTDSS
jgi:ethanolamine ammonia-lyase large subunit